MNRRNFMAAILATATAPYIVRAGSLMAVRPYELAPTDYSKIRIATTQEVVAVTRGVGASTNFGELTDAQKKAWAKAIYRDARPTSFFSFAEERAEA